MKSIYRSIQSLDSKVWHGMEELTYNHSKTSRLLAFPLTIGTFIKDNLLAPALCIDHIVLTAKSIKACRVDKNNEENRADIAKYMAYAIGCAIITPLSPIYGILHSITVLFNVALRPFKSAKIYAAERDFDVFIRQEKYSGKRVYTRHPVTKKRILSHSATEKAFAQVIFDRFKQQVDKAANNEEAKNIRFLDEESKGKIRDEVLLKKEEFAKAYQVYTKKYFELEQKGKPNVENLMSLTVSVQTRLNIQKEMENLKKLWKKFQVQFIAAFPEQLSHVEHIFKEVKEEQVVKK